MIEKDNIIGFDPANKNIEDQRKILQKCIDHKIRIALELTTSCYGNCMGCALSSDSKRAAAPIFSIEQLKKTFVFLEGHINNIPDLYTAVINFGVGDYFMLPDEYFEDVCRETKHFFSKVYPYRTGFTFTTSLLLKEEKMQSKIDIIKKYFHTSETLIEFVIDPMKLTERYDLYVKNYQYLIKQFPFMDFVINIAEGLTTEHAANVVKYTKEIDVQHLEVQYAIKNTNNYRVKIEQDKFNEFFQYIYDNYDKKIVINSSVSEPTHNGEESILYYMEKFAKKIIGESILIDFHGNIYPVPTGFGDVLLDERYGFPPIGNIITGIDVEGGTKLMVDYLRELFRKNKACHICEHNKECYSSGYAFYNKFNTGNGNKCENIGIDYVTGKRTRIE